MPVRKVKGGYKVGKGKATYPTKRKAKQVNRAIHARRSSRKR